MAASRWMWAKLESHGIMQVMCCFFGISPYLLFCYVANVLQISDKQAHNKGIRNKNLINAKSVQLIELHAFAYSVLCVYLSVLLNLLENKPY